MRLRESAFRFPFARVGDAAAVQDVGHGAVPDLPIGRVAAVEEGKCVGVYPEGTLTRDPHLWPMTGRTGAARIALRIVSCATSSSDSARP